MPSTDTKMLQAIKPKERAVVAPNFRGLRLTTSTTEAPCAEDTRDHKDIYSVKHRHFFLVGSGENSVWIIQVGVVFQSVSGVVKKGTGSGFCPENNREY